MTPRKHVDSSSSDSSGSAAPEQRSLYTLLDTYRPLSLEEERPEPYRTATRRDYARLIHSTSFRRLQGKTQLFYGNDSIFRNRLTHSLEVAQIAKSIAFRLNHEFFGKTFSDQPPSPALANQQSEFFVNPDICEIAGIAHDLGHPPFGHNGEKALDDFMRDCGGFEGNAQTLRILTRLDKREKQALPQSGPAYGPDSDLRYGMNLTFRSIASTLKYFNEIAFDRRKNSPDVEKGFYWEERTVVDNVVKHVLGPQLGSEFLRKPKSVQKQFRTIECAIMDIADDIAYSTYDLEDAWKSGFLDPMELLAIDPKKLAKITSRVVGVPRLQDVTEEKVNEALHALVSSELSRAADKARINQTSVANSSDALLGVSSVIRRAADKLADDGYQRTQFTSELVNRFVRSVNIPQNEEKRFPENLPRVPQLITVEMDWESHLQVTALKLYTYVSVIQSPRLRIPEYRGYKIVSTLAKGIWKATGYGSELLPDDFRDIFDSIPQDELPRRKRLIADFVAGMTDSYAAAFYNRLFRDYPTTVFGPAL